MPNNLGKINILLLVPTFDVGGPGTTVLTIAKSLNPERFNPIICSMRRANLKLEESAKEQNIKVINLNMYSFFDIFVLPKLHHILITEKIDILHNHGFRPELYGSLIGRITKCKGVLTTIHHNPAVDIPLDYGPIIGGMMNFLRKLFAFFCEDVLVVLTEDSKRGLMNLGFPDKKIRVIPTGSSPDLLQQQKTYLNREDVLTKFDIPEDAFVVGTIAVLKPRKDIATLIDAAKILVQDYPNVKFLIIGKGPFKKNLEDQVKSLNLQNHVIFYDYVENIVDAYKIFNILVLPSLTEGVPAVLLEAMAFGVPIVATKVGGVPEVIEDGVSGILVPPQNPEALAGAIIKAYKDSNLRRTMTENARNRFEKYFTAEAMARQYEKVYEELLKS